MKLSEKKDITLQENEVKSVYQEEQLNG